MSATGRTSPVPTATAPRSHLTQYNGMMTFLDTTKEDARSSEQHAMREASGNDGWKVGF